MALGSVLGGIAGGVIGSIPSLGIGAPAGFAMGSAIGGGIEGAIQKKKAEGMEIPSVTPLQTQLYEEIRSRRKAMEAGTMYQPQQQAIQQTGQGAMRSAVQATGGDIGATISALQKIQRGTGRSLNELYGQMMQSSNQLLGARTQMATDFANREYQVAAYNKLQMLADATQKQKDAKMIMAGMIAQKLKAEGFSDDDIWEQLQKWFQGIFDKSVTEGGGAGVSLSVPDMLMPQQTGIVPNTQNPLFK